LKVPQLFFNVLMVLRHSDNVKFAT